MAGIRRRARSTVLTLTLARSTVLTLTLALGAAACGGGDDGCAGYISINATPEQCAQIAERFGCTSYEVDGPSCGLTACVTCTDL